MKAAAFTITLFFLGISFLHGQTALIKGKITNPNGKVVLYATLGIEGTRISTSSDSLGNYQLTVPASRKITLQVNHLEHLSATRLLNLKPDQVLELNVVLLPKTTQLDQVDVEGKRDNREEAGSVTLDIEQAKKIPSPFGEFNQMIISGGGLGIVGNNELSSAYSVRGGSFDENLVYVNNIQVYRPFLVRAGQQEGLSFVNPDLVQNVDFSSGGWQSKYGDKLSSVLNITYRQPKQFSGTLTASLLGGNLHLESATRNKKVTASVGARYKSAAYLLGTTETQGEYIPKFTDLQSFLTFDLTGKNPDRPTELGVLLSYAVNDYYVEPESRETRFGTFQDQKSLFIAFEGKELLTYKTTQSGLKLSHKFSKKFTSHLIGSGMLTTEREYTNLESGYRLCNIDNNFSSATFDQCIAVVGIGTNFEYARNELDAAILSAESRNEWWTGEKTKTEFGLRLDHFDIQDNLYEYTFADSADFVTLGPLIESKYQLLNNRFSGYLQQTIFVNDSKTLTYGARFLFNQLNNEWLVSPRVQYAWQPKWKRNVMFRAAAGLYQQPPFYRELRDFSGNVNESVKAQKSAHFIAGLDWNFEHWKRPFKFIAEAYYKRLWDVIPYDVDNVRLRYYAQNNANAYVMGADFRLSGEFIEGAESWFNLSILSAQEDVLDDNRGYIRRPTDQRLTFSVFFQDHLPGNPTMRMNIRAIYGTGLPYGPPNSYDSRNSLSNGTKYSRVDLGFSKIITFKDGTEKGFGIRQIWIGLDILNAFGIDNNISFTWVNDLNNNIYAVPNSLSQRFFNARMSVRF